MCNNQGSQKVLKNISATQPANSTGGRKSVTVFLRFSLPSHSSKRLIDRHRMSLNTIAQREVWSENGLSFQSLGMDGLHHCTKSDEYKIKKKSAFVDIAF